mgnify:FL=1
MEVIDPYLPLIEKGCHSENQSLRQECGIITRIFRNDRNSLATDAIFGAIL